MQVIGIVGGIASGKSTVSAELQRLGAEVLDADRAGHEVLRLPHVRNAVSEHFGPSVVGADGEIDRRRLAGIVFARTAEGANHLAQLERLTHPEIGRRLQELLADLRESESVKAVVLDAPVLMKAGWDDFCDKIVYVEAPLEQRLKRAEARGWTKEDFSAREAAQESLDTKRRRADWIIDNSGSLQSTRAQIEQLWRSWVD